MSGTPPRGRATHHKCAAFMCTKTIPWDHAFCARHWAQLPRSHQVAVSSTFDRTRTTQSHLTALRRAVAALSKQGELELELRADVS